MPRFRITAVSWLFFSAALGLLCASGCSNLFTRSQSPEDEDPLDDTELRIDKVGDHVTVAGLHTQQIEGVGLAVNLDGTGGDPSPSLYRTRLVDDMKKHGVTNPDRTLADPSTALVLIRAVLPPAIQVGDRIDLEVILPESANASSLANGLLLPVSLAEHAALQNGKILDGHVLGKGGGPIMVTTIENGKENAGRLRRGKVLGGGVFLGGQFKKNRPLELYLRSDYRSVRNADRMAKRIGHRFHAMDKGIKRDLAKATTDQHIELQIHPRYRQNYVRYVQVIRQIAITESSVEEHARLERLKKSLMVPRTASSSALDLEAIGGDMAIAILKEGLKSPSEEVRFYSADALAYLGCGDGAVELARATENEEAFRVFALASLSIIDDGETHTHLRQLMNERSTPAETESDTGIQLASTSTETGDVVTADAQSGVIHGAETRYGAFRALRTLDRNDPFIRGEAINQQFMLHVLRTTGAPMIHLSRNKVQEVVLFGANQELRRPLALTAGRYIHINAPAASETITVSRFEVGQPDRERIVSPRLADVIRAVGELGGSYPDVVQMLVQGKQQANLEGRLEIDALPQAGRVYYRKPADAKAKPEETRVGQPERAPNIFPTVDASDLSALDRLSRTPAPPASETKETATKPEDAGEADDAPAPSQNDSAQNDDAPAPSQEKSGFFSNLFKSPFGKKSAGGVPEQSEPELE